MATACARHILVDTLEECQELRAKIKRGEKFEDVALRFSKCPSGDIGGDLGEFDQGVLVRQLDNLIFKDKVALKEIHGPVQTKFGYHLLMITKRNL